MDDEHEEQPPTNRSTWMSYYYQLWAGLRYGIGASLARLKDLENEVKYQVKTKGKKKAKNRIKSGLGTRDQKILSMLGICQSISTEWRYLPLCYGSMELNCLIIEAAAASLNLFLQHYGTDTFLGTYLTASIENLQLELGVRAVHLTTTSRSGET